GHELRTSCRRRVDRDLVRPGQQHGARLCDGADAPGDAERDVDLPGHPVDPGEVDAAALGAGRDVVEHQLVGPLRTVVGGQLGDAAHVLVVAEPGPLDDPAVTDVEAGDDPACQ